MEEREEVTFDIGGPIGPIPQSVSNLTSFVGTIGRNKRFVTLLYTKKWVIQTIRDAWKRFKAKIKQKHFIPYDNIEDMVKNRPLQVPEYELIKLLLYWSHPTIQEVSQRNKKKKEQQKFPHRIGPINFARVRAALRESKGTNKEPKRFEVFIATRTSRKRKELDEGTQSAIEMFQSRQALVQQRRKLSSPYLEKNSQGEFGAMADP
ncbi:hypothetical protein PIB30_076767 [Stylosanthes scabra]|uniref:Uncharacterized protein n=1 Tax=Stylosanthes scabra TaxID=79078 RepID=A0ABU6RQM0_9FABA|nr:hypothetical protein [Stylosanthes scabra]